MQLKKNEMPHNRARKVIYRYCLTLMEYRTRNLQKSSQQDKFPGRYLRIQRKHRRGNKKKIQCKVNQIEIRFWISDCRLLKEVRTPES